MRKLALAAILMTLGTLSLLAQYPDQLVDQAREAIRNFDIPTADKAYKDAMKAVDEDEYKTIQAEWQELEKINILLADGRRSWERAEYDESMTKYKQAIAQMNSSKQDIWGKVKGEAHYSMGMAYFRQEQAIQAAAEFKNAMEFDPQEPKFGRAIEMVRNNHYSEGHKYFKRKDYVSAKEQYEIAVAVDPSFASGYYQLALIAKLDGDLRKSESNYRNAVNSDPTHNKAWYGLGSLYYDMGNNSKAIEALKMSISIDDTYEKAYYVLAQVYDSQKNERLAIENLKKAIEINASYRYAYELLSKIYVDQENWNATIALLKDLKGKSTSRNTYYRLAQAYNGKQDYSAAYTAATKSLASKKNWAPALIEQGDALKGLGKNKDAIIAYRSAGEDARWKSVSDYRIDELTKWEGK